MNAPEPSEQLRRYGIDCAAMIARDPGTWLGAAAWLRTLPLCPLPETIGADGSPAVGPTMQRMLDGWDAATYRFLKRDSDRYHDFGLADAQRVGLLLALTFDSDFDGSVVGLDLPWDRRSDGGTSMGGREWAWNVMTTKPVSVVVLTEVANVAMHRLRCVPPPRPAADGNHDRNDLAAALDSFSTTLESVTVPDDAGGRRIHTLGGARALNDVADELRSRVKGALDGAIGPLTPRGNGVQTGSVTLGRGGADPMLMAALESIMRVLAFPADQWNEAQARRPGANHSRFRYGGVITVADLEVLASARKCIQPAMARPPANPADNAKVLSEYAKQLRTLPGLRTSTADRGTIAGRIVEAAIERGAFSEGPRCAWLPILRERLSYRTAHGEPDPYLSAFMEVAACAQRERGLTDHPDPESCDTFGLVADVLEAEAGRVRLPAAMAEATTVTADTPSLDGWDSMTGLVNRFGVPKNKIRSLKRHLHVWRVQHPCDTRRWSPQENQGRAAPRYMYCVRQAFLEVVQPLLGGGPGPQADPHKKI